MWKLFKIFICIYFTTPQIARISTKKSNIVLLPVWLLKQKGL